MTKPEADTTIAGKNPPSLRFIAGVDSIATAERTVDTLQKQMGALGDLSGSLALDEETSK